MQQSALEEQEAGHEEGPDHDDCEEDDILFGSSNDYLEPVYDYDEYENTSDYEDSKDYENIFPEYGENPNDSVEPSDFENINPKDTSRFQQVLI